MKKNTLEWIGYGANLLLVSIFVGVFMPAVLMKLPFDENHPGGEQLVSRMNFTKMTDVYVPFFDNFHSQIAFWPHAIAALLYPIIPLFQYLPAIRKNYPGIHVWLGRTWMVVSLVAGVTGTILTVNTVVGGYGWTSACFVLAASTFVATPLAWYYAYIRDIPNHKKWVTRSYMWTGATILFRPINAIIVTSIVFNGKGDQLFESTLSAFDLNATILLMCEIFMILLCEYTVSVMSRSEIDSSDKKSK